MSNTSFHKKHFPFGITITAMLVLLLLVLIASVCIGQVNISFGNTVRILVYHLFHTKMSGYDAIPSSYDNIVWMIRFPRALIAALVGTGLSLCGIIMQASVENPLADPYILGISSGATLGASIAMMTGITSLAVFATAGVSIMAFLGALLASALVLFFANIGGKATGAKLVLAGTVINSMFTAFSDLIIYLSNNTQALQNITFWIMGSTASATWDKLPRIAIVVILSLFFFLTQSNTLNLMLMGEEAATTLGVNLTFWRRIYLILSSLLTGILVSTCGMIGFVGLVIPHIVRAVCGADHKRLTLYAALTGGTFMVITDLISRTILPGSELPVGIITAALGAPVFLYMLISRSYGFGGN